VRVSQLREHLARRGQELDRAIKTLRGFERDYRVRLRGFVEDQLKLLEDAAPVDSLAPPSSELEGLPGWDDEPPVAAAATPVPDGSVQFLRVAAEQLGTNGRKDVDQPPQQT
jgi:hypothetical protein